VCDELDVCSTPKAVCLESETGQTLAELETAAAVTYPLFFCDVPADEPTCDPFRETAVDGSGEYTGEISPSDLDGDGVVNASDDCAAVFNPVRPVDDGEQADADQGGKGDACDRCPLGPCP
jgi:large repetitive protein